MAKDTGEFWSSFFEKLTPGFIQGMELKNRLAEIELKKQKQTEELFKRYIPMATTTEMKEVPAAVQGGTPLPEGAPPAPRPVIGTETIQPQTNASLDAPEYGIYSPERTLPKLGAPPTTLTSKMVNRELTPEEYNRVLQGGLKTKIGGMPIGLKERPSEIEKPSGQIVQIEVTKDNIESVKKTFPFLKNIKDGATLDIPAQIYKQQISDRTGSEVNNYRTLVFENTKTNQDFQRLVKAYDLLVDETTDPVTKAPASFDYISQLERLATIEEDAASKKEKEYQIAKLKKDILERDKIGLMIREMAMKNKIKKNISVTAEDLTPVPTEPKAAPQKDSLGIL